MLRHTRTHLAATLVVSAVTALFFLCGGTVSASAHINASGASASPTRSADLSIKHLRLPGTPVDHAARSTTPNPHTGDADPVTLTPDSPTVRAPYGVDTVSRDSTVLYGQDELHSDSRGPPA